MTTMVVVPSARIPLRSASSSAIARSSSSDDRRRRNRLPHGDERLDVRQGAAWSGENRQRLLGNALGELRLVPIDVGRRDDRPEQLAIIRFHRRGAGDDAPIGTVRNDELGDRFDREVKVEGGREKLTDVGQKARALLGMLDWRGDFVDGGRLLPFGHRATLVQASFHGARSRIRLVSNTAGETSRPILCREREK
jgi:hypothetical protein